MWKLFPFKLFLSIVLFNIGYKLAELIGAIVNDDRDAETNIKIYDYRCDLNKGFFTSSPNMGIEPLVEDIVKKANR